MLKAEYKYIDIQQSQIPTSINPADIYYIVRTKNKTMLGTIEFYNIWQKWVFAPNGNTVYSSRCLEDLKHFIDRL